MNVNQVRPSRGVVIFGWLLIISSLIHIHKIVVDSQWYFDVYSYMPPWMMVLRYSFSWFQRALGILAGIGLLALKDVARKLAIAVACFTILTIYWKHPYAAYKPHMQYMDHLLRPLLTKIFGPFQIQFTSLTEAAVILNCLGDIVFCGTLIYFLTRPSVKQQFRSGL